MSSVPVGKVIWEVGTVGREEEEKKEEEEEEEEEQEEERDEEVREGRRKWGVGQECSPLPNKGRIAMAMNTSTNQLRQTRQP